MIYVGDDGYVSDIHNLVDRWKIMDGWEEIAGQLFVNPLIYRLLTFYSW